MSNLLSQASLVMIPSGYKEDVVYSQIPTNGNGDLSFTRASNGTRINSAGLVEVCPWNLFTYSEDFANADWIKVGSTISSNVLVAPNGTTTADKLVEDTSNGVHIALQITGGRNVSSIYAFSVYAKAGERTKINLFNNGNGVGEANFDLVNGTATLIAGEFATIESVGNGWYRCVVGMQENSTAGNFNYHIRLLDGSGSNSYTGNGTSGAYIWGAQVNLGTAKPYFPTTDRLNVPRLTYQNGGGGCPSLLLEKQSTNVVTYSEQLDNGAWVKSGSNSVTANAIISPDGTQNADFVVSTATNSSPKYVYQVISSTATPTATIYAKAGAVTQMMFYCQGGNGIYFNLTNGSFVAYYAGGASTITSYSSIAVGNGWYRYSITFNTSVTSIEAYLASGGSISPLISNGDGFYLWGAQLEPSSYATSYIPTTSSSATRVADACFKTGISSLIGQTEGVVFLDSYFDEADKFNLSVNDGTSSNFIQIETTSGAAVVANINSGGVAQASMSTSSSFFTSGQRLKIAIAYKSNDFALYINGAQIATDSSGSVPSTDQFICARYNGSLAASQRINELILFKTRLSNSELASLTTI